MRTTKATNGCCRKKKQKLQKRFRNSCIENRNMRTLAVDERRLHTRPADSPMSTYNTLHTTEKTYPGGVSDDFWSSGYHVDMDSLCNNIEMYPTSNEMTMNLREVSKVFIKR